MEPLFWTVIGAALIACAVTTFGIHVIREHAKWAKHNAGYFVAFAAGVLITVSFMHLIPEAFEMNSFGPIYFLSGFFALYLLDRYLDVFVCSSHILNKRAFGIIPALGIGIHSFIDGMIYAVTFKVSIFTGMLTALGMVLHEFPEGIVTFVLLVKSGFTKKKAAHYAFFAAALTTPLGALLAFPLINKVTEPTLGILLSISAGALVYVGATHLLPETKKENIKTVLALAAGIAIAIAIMFLH